MCNDQFRWSGAGGFIIQNPPKCMEKELKVELSLNKGICNKAVRIKSFCAFPFFPKILRNVVFFSFQFSTINNLQSGFWVGGF